MEPARRGDRRGLTMPAAIVDEIGSIGPPGFMQMARKQVGHLRFDETRHALDGEVIRHRGG
jgi:hypothetical protein